MKEQEIPLRRISNDIYDLHSQKVNTLHTFRLELCKPEFTTVSNYKMKIAVLGYCVLFANRRLFAVSTVTHRHELHPAQAPWPLTWWTTSWPVPSKPGATPPP